MKNLIFTIVLISICSLTYAQEQEPTEPETFQMEWEGEKVTMQKYFIVFLKKGPNRDQPEEERQQIQEKHLAYLGKLFKEGVLNINGPTGDNGEISGISVYSTATLEEAVELAEGDPAVQAGRLVVEAHSWWVAKGSSVK
ncbi:YciI family protein [Aliifodinibius salicampi]|uniref:YciI family protein n=1 Tax=Fodinibius salicampi TaxID=1920655 RepID=A0ABT3PZN1_9BACT|nr:YciI family protein [Fodinibius salicampi]MCW9713324.1 YciI family protein [Fodinibius salicampi]